MATTEQADRRAPRAGEGGASRTDVVPRPTTDAEHPPGSPPVNPFIANQAPPPPEGRGLAVPVLYASLALAHVGGDERERSIGAIYALAALYHILGR